MSRRKEVGYLHLEIRRKVRVGDKFGGMCVVFFFRCILKMIELFLEISLGCNKQFKLGCLQVNIPMSSITKQFPRLVILAK